MRPLLGPHSPSPAALACWGVSLAAALGATASNGATEHVAALVLRVLGLAAAVAAWRPVRAGLAPGHAVAPLTAVLVVAWGTLVAHHPGLALQALISVGVIVLLFWSFATSDRDLTRPALALAVTAGLVHAVWAVAQSALGSERATGGFFNPNDLAAFLAPLAVIALGASVAGPRGRWAAATALAAGVLATGSRSGMVALVLGVAIRLSARRLRLAAAALLVGVVLSLALPSLRDRWRGARDSFAYSRVAIWRASLAMTREALPWGVGASSFEEALRVRGVPLAGWVRYPRTASHAHSEPLNAAAELGVPGVAAVLLPLAWLLRELLRRRRRGLPASPAATGDETAAADLGVLAAFAAPALFSASLHVPPVALLAAVWAARVARHAEPGPAGPPRPWVRSRLPAAVVAGLITVAAVPGAVAQALSGSAVRHRVAGRPAQALTDIERATRVTPWALGMALYREQLRHESGAPALEVAGNLVALADEFPHSPKPLTAATALLESLLPTAVDAAGARRAIAALSAEAARRDPRNALAWTELGRARLAQGDHDGARGAFARAVAEEPHCARALAYLAMESARAGDEEGAAHLARQAVAASARAEAHRGHARAVLSLDPVSAKILSSLEVFVR